MISALSFLWNWLLLALSAALCGWVLYRWLRKSDEPGTLVTRWLVTVVLGAIVTSVAVKAKDEISQIFAILVGLVCGVGLAILWGPSFCGWVARQFTGLYDGGDLAPDPRPLYSIAEAKRKQGKYAEAIEEVQKQLEEFPNDFTGWMMLAEIQAENLKDLAGAQDLVERILAQEGQAPKNIAFALGRLADWHLKLARDRDSARLALEKIVELLPDSEEAQLARQRIAHLTPLEMLQEEREPRRIALQHHEENLGLRPDYQGLKPLPEPDPASIASTLIAHLQQHPHDYEARENLALIYADHYRRIDLAGDQLEQLLEVPHQPAKQVVHWLNMLADLQIRVTGDANLARQTLQRIVGRFPKTAAAENARHRMAQLNLELRPKQTTQTVKLGAYEDKLGLNRNHPSEGGGGQSAFQSR